MIDRSEVPMSSVLLEPFTHEEEILKSPARTDSKPRLESYDSADECSFAHLMHVYQLIDLEEATVQPRYLR